MLKVISAQRTERIPEKEFDLDPRVEQGCEIIARKDGYVYIGFNRALYDRLQAEHVASVMASLQKTN